MSEANRVNLTREDALDLVESFPLVPQRAQSEQLKSARKKRRLGPIEIAPRCTDVANSELLAEIAGNRYKYVTPWRRWLVWNDQAWIDDTGELVEDAKEVAQHIFKAALEHRDEHRRTLTNHAVASASANKISAMIKLLQTRPDFKVLPAALDSDPWVLNVANGTVDLRTMQLRGHQPGDLVTKIAPYEFWPKTDLATLCPRWLRFLEEILPDAETREFVHRAVGYSLTGDTREQCLFILHGTGANGKTTFIEMLLGFAGNYGMRTPSETLLMKRNDSIPSDVAALRGARLVVAAEIEDGRRLAEARVKELTGGDTVSACFKYGEWFQFKPVCKLWLSTNHRPRIRGSEHAIWRRIHLIPFEQRFGNGGLPADLDLACKLQSEMPGILTWAILGVAKWLKYGLSPPEKIAGATAAYRGEQDTVAAFLDECCHRRQGSTATAAEIYQAYRQWCEQNGEHAMTQRALSQQLKEVGFQQTRTNRARGWAGLAMR